MTIGHIPFWILGISLPYWGFMGLFIFNDLYLIYRSTGFLLKAVLPFMLISNLVGVGIGILLLPRGKAKACAAIILNLLPLIGVICFAWWLFFGVDI